MARQLTIDGKQLQDSKKALETTGASMREVMRFLGEIDGLVRNIRDIAGKTDLLALNASIEAARAGHAGKGFAIVADEVGRLSEKVQTAVDAVELACVGMRKTATQAASGVEGAQKLLAASSGATVPLIADAEKEAA